MDVLLKIQKVIESSLLEGCENKDYANFASMSKREIYEIGKLTNQDFSGYVHCIDRSGVIHSLKHKNITLSDILLIPYIIENFDSIELGNKEDTLMYKKMIGNEYFLVEEIRRGRKKLALKTLCKKVKK